jgi:molybdopterin/thiamine biosynthesis adenylyltransferase
MGTIAKLKIPTALNFPLLQTRTCRAIRVNQRDWRMTDRQERFQWWKQEVIRRCRALIIGCGGLGSNQGRMLTQMGFGHQDYIDPKVVTDNSRNRQFFQARDVGLPKAHRLLSNLEPYAVYNSRLRGYYMTFEEWAARPTRRPKYDVICCGVDSMPSAAAVAAYGLKTSTAVIVANVSADGEACRIFIQRTGPADACFGCYRPELLEPAARHSESCAPVPAIADILHVAVGFATRAAIGELLGVPIGDYNCRDITFTGFDITKTVAKNPACALCGGKQLT